MKPDTLKIYILEVVLLFGLFFALFVLNDFTKIVLAVCMTIYMVITCKCIKNRKILSTEHKQVILFMGAMALIYVGIYYALRFVFWVL